MSVHRRAPTSGRVRRACCTLAVAALGASSCLPGSSGEDRGAGPPPDAGGAAMLHVENGAWLDVTVYLEGSIGSRRLVAVPSLRSGSAPLPEALLRSGGRVRLRADFTGDLQDFRSELFDLRPGMEVWWRLEQTLRNSTLWIR